MCEITYYHRRAKKYYENNKERLKGKPRKKYREKDIKAEYGRN